MRKRTIKILSFVLAIGVLFAAAVPASALDVSKPVSDNMQTCPTAALEYAKNSFDRFFQGSLESEVLSDVSGTAYLGMPFVPYFVPNVEGDIPAYYFPIINNGRFVGTFRVYRDIAYTNTVYVGIMSELYAAELNQLKDCYNATDPIVIYEDNGNIMADINGEKLVMWEDRMGNKPLMDNELAITAQVQTIPALSATTVRSLMTSIGVSSTLSAEPNSATENYLNLSIIETQGQNNWCGAYVTAAIMRYLKGNTKSPTAAGLMSLFYRRPTANDKFKMDQTVQYAKSNGYNPTKLTGSLTSTQVFNQIDARKPIYLNVRRSLGAGQYAYHAIVLRGYNKRRDYYSVWNPWGTKYENMDLNTKTYFCPGKGTYSWYATIYNW